ncbi:DUF6973 domain-containing protein [Neisseria chenwenguii]|uniref:DUF6973 domain-containing protein n=1 Tax=Neisseria chenwenguii TaxID=1853278 RepID=A0A220RZP4_9NEIS|nr:hypothetical protein [Neisseria chenwenguii]ASK26701.1 hypothetical protein BG910_02120 [Neisseria chenwenguii]ROV56363.1 hypothetical protein EGS38_04925 [Neisseria chenwenguii]
MTHLKLLILSAALLTGCQTYQEHQSRRSKIAQFVVNHPVAAKAIGVETKRGVNISSNAARLAERTGLDDKANGDGRGTQVNAVRHTLWQAAISSRFDSIVAERAGNAYLSDMEVREGKTDYYSRYAADQAVDIRNNRIGRSIGSGKPNADMKTLTNAVLFYYHKIGLWTASSVQSGGRKVWRIRQSKLSAPVYRQAVKNIEPLSADGMTVKEECRRNRPDRFYNLKQSIKAIKQLQD